MMKKVLTKKQVEFKVSDPFVANLLEQWAYSLGYVKGTEEITRLEFQYLNPGFLVRVETEKPEVKIIVRDT